MSRLIDGRRHLEQVGGLRGERVDVGQRGADRLAVGGQPRDEPLELVDQVLKAGVAGVHGAEDGVEVGDGAADDLVAVGEGRGQRRGVGQQRVDVAALALQDLDDLAGRAG